MMHMLLRRNAQQLSHHIRACHALLAHSNSCWVNADPAALIPTHSPSSSTFTPHANPLHTAVCMSTSSSTSTSSNHTKLLQDLHHSAGSVRAYMLTILDRIWPHDAASPTLTTLYHTMQHNPHNKHIDMGTMNAVQQELNRYLEEQRGDDGDDVQMLSATLLLLGLVCHAQPHAHSTAAARTMVHSILETLSKVDPPHHHSSSAQHIPADYALSMHYGTSMALLQVPHPTTMMLLRWLWPVLSHVGLIDLVFVLKRQSSLMASAVQGSIPQEYVQEHAALCMQGIEDMLVACAHTTPSHTLWCHRQLAILICELTCTWQRLPTQTPPAVNVQRLSTLVTPHVPRFGAVKWVAEGLLGFSYLQLPATHPAMCELSRVLTQHMHNLQAQHAGYVFKGLSTMQAVPETFDYEAFGQRVSELLPNLTRSNLSDLLYCLMLLGQAPTTLSRERLGEAIMVNTSGAFRVPRALTACNALGWMPDNVDVNTLLSRIPPGRPIKPHIIIGMLQSCARFARYVSWNNVAPLLAHLPAASVSRDGEEEEEEGSGVGGGVGGKHKGGQNGGDRWGQTSHGLYGKANTYATSTYATSRYAMKTNTLKTNAKTQTRVDGVVVGMSKNNKNGTGHSGGGPGGPGGGGIGYKAPSGSITPARWLVLALQAMGLCRVLMPLDHLDRTLGDLAEGLLHLPHWHLVQLIHTLLTTYHSSPSHHPLVLSFVDHCIDTLGHSMLGHAWEATPPDAEAAAKGLLFCIHGPLARKLLESAVLYARMGKTRDHGDHHSGDHHRGKHGYAARMDLLPRALRMVCEAVLPGAALERPPVELEGMEAAVMSVPHVLKDMSMMPTTVQEALVLADVYATMVSTGQRVALRGSLQRLRFAAMPMATGPESVQPLLAEAVGVKLVTLEQEASGVSMIPTLTGAGNECLLMERVSVWSNNVQVGDVVVATSMTQPCGTIVKRVVALQGQQVRLRTHHGGGEEGPTRVVEVPRGHVWLQGDNYYNSRDSRDFGAMPYAMLRGRVFAVAWPPTSARFIGRSAPWKGIEP